MPATCNVVFYSAVGGLGPSNFWLTHLGALGWKVSFCQIADDVEYRRPQRAGAKALFRSKVFLRYPLRCWRQAGRSREAHNPTVHIVTTNPFFLPALVRWRSDDIVIHLLYDLYPDALVQAGKIKAGSWMARRLSAFTRYALRQCDATVFLGEHLRRRTEEKYGAARHAATIPTGTMDGAFAENRPLSPAHGTITILYAGNLGRMHDSRTLGEVLDARLPARLRFRFFASGTAYERLRHKFPKSASVTFSEPLPDDQWAREMRQAQVALVTVADGAEEIVMPSKTYGALAAGQAILAICNARSDLARLVTDLQCGWIVEPGDIAGMLRCLHEIANDSIELDAKRNRAYAAGHGPFSSRSIAQRWDDLLRQAIQRRTQGVPRIT